MKGRVHLTTRFARYRVLSPRLFVTGSLRTQDVGRKGHSKRIAGRLKKSGKWATQSFLVSRKDYDKGLRYSLTKKKVVKQKRR